MRKSLLVALLGVGLLAAPSFGVITANLVVDNPALNPGESTTVHLFVENAGGTAAIFAVAVQVAADVPGVIASSVPVTFVAPISDVNLGGSTGVVGPNGGVDDVAGSQPLFGPGLDLNYGLAGPVEALNFEVTAVGNPGDVVNLTILNEFDVPGFAGINDLASQTGDEADYTGATITIVPEPATLALLALGGLVAARRRK